MTIQIFKNGQLQTSLPEDQAFTSILSDFDKYKQYYENAGYTVKQVGPVSTAVNRETQLQQYAAGQGPRPAGLQSGFAAPTGYDKGGALAQGLQKPSATGQAVSDGTTGPSGEIRVLMPNQQQQFFSIQDPALDAALQAGARPIGPDGSISTDARQFNGGWIVRSGNGYVPLNVLAGGEWLPGQQEALTAGGLDIGEGYGPGGTPGATPPPGAGQGGQGPIPTGGGAGGPSGAGGYLTNGWMGNQSATAPALPQDLNDALYDLMNRALTQGERGQEALTGLIDDYKNYLGFTRSAAEQTFGKRDELTERLAGQYSPTIRGIESAMQTMNQATGLSPEAMQALRLNAIEAPERAYQGQVEQLKSTLAQRGAYGGGALPGDAGALVRGYAPLMQGRDAARSNLLANAILADEQRKFDTLGLNRQTAASAMNTGAGLAGALASAYNPTGLIQSGADALSGLGQTVNARTGAGFQGLNTAGGLLQTGFENQPTSFKNMLLAALAGTGGNILADPNNWSKIGDFFKGLWPDSNSGTPTQTTGQLPIPTNPFPTNPAPTTPTTPPYV